MQQLRAQVASALGLRTQRFCTAVATALVLGMKEDPAIRVRLELLQAWLQYWHRTPAARPRAQRTWMRLLPKLQ
eukprot:15054620-Alexandrium_andersonii.AAC.1